MYNLTVSLVVVSETGQLLEGPSSLFLISNISTFSTKCLILDHYNKIFVPFVDLSHVSLIAIFVPVTAVVVFFIVIAIIVIAVVKIQKSKRSETK